MGFACITLNPFGIVETNIRFVFLQHFGQVLIGQQQFGFVTIGFYGLLYDANGFETIKIPERIGWEIRRVENTLILDIRYHSDSPLTLHLSTSHFFSERVGCSIVAKEGS